MTNLQSLSASESAPTVKIATPYVCRRGWILEIQDEEQARNVPISGTLTIGSKKAASVIVEDATVSAVHVEATALPDGVILRDVGSTNGMWTGGGRINEVWGSEGTVVTIGHTTIVVRSNTDADEEEPVG